MAMTRQQISKNSYYAFGGCLNSDLMCMTDTTGYTTYYYTGVGPMSYKEDKPKGPKT